MTLSAPRNTESDTKEPAAALLELGRMLQRADYHFTTVTPLTHRRVNARAESAWAETLADVFGWSRPFKDGILSSAMQELLRAANIAVPHEDGWRSRLRASTLGQHLYFHSAFPTVESNAVFFGPDTYRFIRALEAELLTLRSRVRRAADIGCGAGPGAIAIAEHCPQADVLAIDINDAALQLTAVNAALAGTANVKPCNSNLMANVESSFDLIVSNPPYLLDRGRRAYRDGGGEFGDGLSLAIVDAAAERLAPGGSLLMYTGAVFMDGGSPFLLAAAERLDRADFIWRCEELDPDVFGEELEEPGYEDVERIAALWLVARKLG
jgi:methylase of polypeptide subunit release factors